MSGEAPHVVAAPAKLTLSLRVTGVRPDGYHTIESEMVTVDLCDLLEIDPRGDGLSVVGELPGGRPLTDLGASDDNLVSKALRAVGRRAHVTLRKRIPPQAGLGGGSADAAAILRWAGCCDLALAARLGGDVPFCVLGGRAHVAGIGEQVEPLQHVDRRFVLLLPPLAVDTATCYRGWDVLVARGRHEAGAVGSDPAAGDVLPDSTNDLELPAIAVVPALARWRDAFAERTGRRPQLAGSGATWFVEGSPEELGLGDERHLTVGQQHAPLVPVRTVPACTPASS